MERDEKQHKIRRHQKWRVLALSLAALLPLAWLIQSRRAEESKASSTRNLLSMDNPLPVSADSPWRIDDKTSSEPIVALSSSGRFLAGICTALPTPNATPTPDSMMAQNSDLVIWRVQDRAEVARVRLGDDAGNRLQWSSDESLVATYGYRVQVYQWKSGTLVKAPVSKPLSGGAGASILNSWLNLDGDLKVQASSSNILQAFRISSGASIPLAPEIGSKINVGAVIALQPAPLGGSIRLAVLQEEPTPTPTPGPTPTPSPTPTLSPAQNAFNDKVFMLSEEASAILERLEREDGVPREEAAQLKARANAINAQIEAERKRVFGSPIPSPTPSPPPRLLRRGHLELWDLQRGRIVWQKRLHLRTSMSWPALVWSPDGKFLIVRGTPRFRKAANPTMEERGLEFLDGATGKSLGSSSIEQNALSIDSRDMAWLPGPQFVFKDHGAQSHMLLRRFDVRNGKALPPWSLPDAGQFDMMTTDRSGKVWVLASSRLGWRVLSRSQIEPKRTAFHKTPNSH